MTGPHWKARTDELRANYDRADRTSALAAVRAGSDQSVELRAKVVLLETELSQARNENDRLRTQINRDAKAREEQYGTLNARFEASQLALGQAVKELERRPC